MSDALQLSAQNRARLLALFKDIPLEEHPSRWDKLWEAGDFLPWDRGKPSPALVDILADKKDIIGSPVTQSLDGSASRKRALVPGCGAGYDVLLFASQGYDAFGLEISENAVKACNKFAESNFGEYAENAPTQGAGSYNFVLGDFYDKENDWFAKVGLEKNTKFDLIYDYTFFCAMPPARRPSWSERMSQLLSAEGRLICLEFPSSKALDSGGPPFGVRSHFYIAHLSDPGNKIPYTSEGEPEPHTYSDEAQSGSQNKLALKRIAYWQPERTHPVGQGTDWVSIWKHR